MNFFPLKEPTYKGVVKLPNENTKYLKHYSYRHYIYDVDEEMTTLMADLKDVDKIELNRYNLIELKEIASKLEIPNYNKMNKPDLLKFIKLKLKK
tara:strand:- start:278 stop:562 length:285 start_codon:yes stop_codon:yes gene_type:complete